MLKARIFVFLGDEDEARLQAALANTLCDDRGWPTRRARLHDEMGKLLLPRG